MAVRAEAEVSIVDLMTDIGDPAFASRYALSLAALAGTLPLAGQRRRGDEDAQDLAIDVASAEAVRTYVPKGVS